MYVVTGMLPQRVLTCFIIDSGQWDTEEWTKCHGQKEGPAALRTQGSKSLLHFDYKCWPLSFSEWPNKAGQSSMLIHRHHGGLTGSNQMPRWWGNPSLGDIRGQDVALNSITHVMWRCFGLGKTLIRYSVQATPTRQSRCKLCVPNLNHRYMNI